MTPAPDSPKATAALDAAATRPFGLAPGWTLVGVTALALVLLAPTLGTRGIIDDADSILRRPLVSHIKHVPQIFSRNYMDFTDGRYQPMPYAVLAAVRTFVSPDNVVFWHAWLAGFWVLGAFLVRAVARHFAGSPEAALAAFAIVLLHPMSAAFGNQINLFPTLLAGTLYLGALACYLRRARGGGVGVYVASLALFAAGLFASRVLMTLPLLILLVEIFRERSRLGRIVIRLLPFVGMTLVVGCLHLVLSPHPVFFTYPPKALPGDAQYWMFSFAAGGMDRALGLLRGASAPVPLSGLFGGIRSVWVLGAIGAVLLGAVAACVWALRRGVWLAVGAFLLFISMLPRFGMPENLTPDLESWSYAYLPLAGFALLAGALTDALLTRRLRRAVLAVAAGGVLVYAGLFACVSVQARTAQGWWRHAMAENTRDESASVALGKLCLAEGDEENALKFLFSSRTDRVRESCLAMARHYARKGEWNAAGVHLLIAAREESAGLAFQEVTLTQAEVLQEAGAWDYAEQQLGGYLMVNPNSTVALRRLAGVFAAKGYVPAAMEVLRGVADLDPGDAETARVTEAMGKRLYEPETHDAATKVTPPAPDWLRYVNDQGGSWYLAEAAGLADRHPSDPIIQMVAGISLGEAGENQRALARIARAIEMLPLYTRPRAARCWVAASLGNERLAVETAEGVTRVKPWDRGIWHQIGFGLWSRGQQEAALACLRRALDADPNSAELQNDMGAMLLMRGQSCESLPYFRKALLLPGGDRGAIHNGLGYALMTLGTHDEAMVHLRRAVDLDPWYVFGYKNIAMLSDAMGRSDEGVRALSDGIERNPADLTLPFELAWRLAASPQAPVRDGARAVKLAERVCAHASPVAPGQLDVLAMAYAEAGRFELAATTARRAADLARSQGQAVLAGAIDQRRGLYEARHPFHYSAAARKER